MCNQRYYQEQQKKIETVKKYTDFFKSLGTWLIIEKTKTVKNPF